MLLDIFLPDRSGWRVLQSLKHDPKTQDIPVVVLSVNEDRAHALALGAAEHIVKPADRDTRGHRDALCAQAPAPATQQQAPSPAAQKASAVPSAPRARRHARQLPSRACRLGCAGIRSARARSSAGPARPSPRTALAGISRPASP